MIPQRLQVTYEDICRAWERFKSYNDLTTMYHGNGAYDGGFWGEGSTVTTKNLVPHCSNCGTKLGFNLINSKYVTPQLEKDIIK